MSKLPEPDRTPAKRGWARLVILGFGLLLAAWLLLFSQLDPANPRVSITAGLAVLMATLWITEWIPLAATSLLPMVILPLGGVMSGKDVARNYFTDIIFLYIGGFIIALAMERWNLHRRIALRTLLFFGSEPRMLMLGFMLVSTMLSMWISNTATTMMMMTVVMAVLRTMDAQPLPSGTGPAGGKLGAIDNQCPRRRFGSALLLASAYAATIGGVSTLVGTPPNLSFVAILGRQFPEAPDIDFATWLIAVGPVSVVMFLLAWGVLTMLYVRPRQLPRMESGVLKQQYGELGPMGWEERVVLVAFLAVAILWVSRAGISMGTWEIPGWSRFLPHGSYVKDGSVAIAVALVLFFVPISRNRSEVKTGVGDSSPGAAGRIMDWQTASKLPWNIILLFGGGFALAASFKESGLTAWAGDQLTSLEGASPLVLIVLACGGITMLTELTSNLATTEMLLPIVATAAIGAKLHPLMLMIPVTLSCSCAFMMPVATPPNAIVFGTRRVSIQQMVRTGIILNLLGVAVIALFAFWWIPFCFGFQPDQVPAWAAD